MATQIRRRVWALTIGRQIQTLLERLLLVGGAIAVRKMLEKYMDSSELAVDTELQGRVGSRAERELTTEALRTGVKSS